MKQLTPEQIKTLEDAFASYANIYKGLTKYTRMEGIQEQLDEGEQIITYISEVQTDNTGTPSGFVMSKLTLN